MPETDKKPKHALLKTAVGCLRVSSVIVIPLMLVTLAFIIGDARRPNPMLLLAALVVLFFGVPWAWRSPR